MHIPIKVISLSNSAYEILAALKRKGESFSDVVLRLSKKERKKPISAFAGKWSGEDIDYVFSQVLKGRKEGKSREVRL